MGAHPRFKFLSLEVSLAAAAEEVREQLASRIQEQRSSRTMELIHQIARLIQEGADELCLINLDHEDQPGYWWSTRLYLLSALAEDYTEITAFVYVDQGDRWRFIGMATRRHAPSPCRPVSRL